ncbi:MAG: alpha/beta fold hydrolase [Thermomicrobiales bacterium]
MDRTDLFATSEPGISIFVREIKPASASADLPPLLLVHGGGPGGLASFDLPVPGYSLAHDLAMAGHAVYVSDVRGWSGSTRPPALDAPAADNPPAVRCAEAARDIGAVVDTIRERRNVERVAILGWASGGHWAAAYAAGHNDRISHLVLLNTIYGIEAAWPIAAWFEASDRPGEFDRAIGAYGLRTAESLLASWDRTIPVEDKTEWRDPRVADAYAREALASDPTSQTRNPPSMRVPTGFQRESYELTRGRKEWDAADIRAATLIVRGERDFWSRPVDITALEQDLVNAQRVRSVTIPDGTHYLFNDRHERGRSQLLHEVIAFLSVPSY